ncbi:hypothetical protein [Ensifer aridi]|uniref:hypothetical protein n=1 Tax=Ensifer aridi TaxID=1708715 RepID=UPI000A11B7A3|nr:hypothetical protein [Ensifer aridi]
MRARRFLSSTTITSLREVALVHGGASSISPLVGEMAGRAEGVNTFPDFRRCDLIGIRSTSDNRP